MHGRNVVLGVSGSRASACDCVTFWADSFFMSAMRCAVSCHLHCLRRARVFPSAAVASMSAHYVCAASVIR